MWHSFLTYVKVHSMLGSNRLFNSIVQISSNRTSREMFFAGAEQHSAIDLVEYGRCNPPTFKPNKYKRTMFKDSMFISKSISCLKITGSNSKDLFALSDDYWIIMVEKTTPKTNWH